jgi:hypothetical protein
MREEFNRKLEGPTAEYLKISLHEEVLNSELKKVKDKGDSNLKRFKEKFETEITHKLLKLETAKEKEI